MRLFCFPYAGASAMVYQRWRRKVPNWLDIKPVELSGRGIKMLEPLAADWETLTATLIREIASDIRQPYVLFGHSLGALIAFEVAHGLHRRGLPLPAALIVSGTHAPSRRDNQRFEQLDSDAQLLAEMQRLNGTEAAILASKELMDLTLPVLRADFKLCARYRRQVRPLLPMPLHVFAGSDDETSDETLRAWQMETTADFSLHYFNGDHFFIQSQEQAVLASLCRHLQPYSGAAQRYAGLYANGLPGVCLGEATIGTS